MNSIGDVKICIKTTDKVPKGGVGVKRGAGHSDCILVTVRSGMKGGSEVRATRGSPGTASPLLRKHMNILRLQ